MALAIAAERGARSCGALCATHDNYEIISIALCDERSSRESHVAHSLCLLLLSSLAPVYGTWRRLVPFVDSDNTFISICGF